MNTTFEQRLGKALIKHEKAKDLVFLHGTGLNDFTQMAHEGVAPNISVAIRDSVTDYSDFGDIIFSLNPHAFFDKNGKTGAGFKIYSRDASTAYTPKKMITLNTPSLNKILESLPEQFGGKENISAKLKGSVEIDWSSALDRIESNSAFMAKFLSDHNIKLPNISYYDKYELPTGTTAILAVSEDTDEFMSRLEELSGHKDIEANVTYMQDLWSKAGNHILDTEPSSFKTKRAAKVLLNATPEEIFEQAPIILNRIKAYQAQTLKLDAHETKKSLKNAILDNNVSSEYKLWVLDAIDRIIETQSYTIGDKRYPDLDSACRAMSRNNGVLEEVGLDVHHRDIIAMSTRMIESKNELEELSKNLDSSFILDFEGAENALSELTHLLSYSNERPVDLITRRDAVKNVIRAIGVGREDINSIFAASTKYIKGVDFEAFCSVADKIKAEIEHFKFDKSARYAEAVINKPISLTDDIISQILVPNNKLNEVLKVAEHYGINISDKVTTYDPTISGSMISKIDKKGVLSHSVITSPKTNHLNVKI